MVPVLVPGQQIGVLPATIRVVDHGLQKVRRHDVAWDAAAVIEQHTQRDVVGVGQPDESS